MALLTPAFNDAKKYPFEWFRYMLELARQEGVVNAADLKTTAAAAGGMRVDVAEGTALIKSDVGPRQGLYIQVNDGPVPNAVTLPNAHPTLPRIDQVVLRVTDSSDIPGSAGDVGTFDVVSGVATAGATLDNRNGAIADGNALLQNCIRLIDVLVPAASTVVVAGNIRDRRARARGVNDRAILTTGDGVGLPGTTFNYVSALLRRYEFSGAPVEVGLRATAVSATGNVYAFVALDLTTGTPDLPGGANDGGMTRYNVAISGGTAGQENNVNASLPIKPTPGTHTLVPVLYSTNGALTYRAQTVIPLVMFVRERLADDYANNN